MSRDDVQVLAGVPEVDRAVVGRQAVQKPIIAEFEGAPALGEGWQMPRNPGSTDVSGPSSALRITGVCYVQCLFCGEKPDSRQADSSRIRPGPPAFRSARSLRHPFLKNLRSASSSR